LAANQHKVLPVNTVRISLLVLVAAYAALTFPICYADANASDCHPGSYRFAGTVSQGKTFTHHFDGFMFALEPNQYGWDIDISRGEQHYLENITGPQHFVPNPIEIAGWHFRNAANTDVNKGDVNAPPRTRRFLFSPRWQQCQDSAALQKNTVGVSRRCSST
jgi:hypothetical protein